jgi:drug/metabolite transporter (DMT)-like permease
VATQSVARSELPARPVLIAFLFFILIAGGGAVATRMTYLEMAPFWVSTARFILAAGVLWVIVFLKRIPFPKGRALLGGVLFGTLTVGLAFLLIAWGLVATPASRYQILMATVPLLTLFLSAIHGVEAISRRGMMGSLLAVGGIGFTVAGGSTSTYSLPHMAAILIGAVLIAEGGVVIKKFPPNPPVLTNAIGMTVGGFILGIASLVSGDRWSIPTQTRTWLAFLYLVVFVSLVGFLLYMFVLSKWSASGTSYGFVMTPLVTVVAASTLAGEDITSNFMLGAILVLAGVLVGALLPSRTRSEVVEECKDRSGQVLPRCV